MKRWWIRLSEFALPQLGELGGILGLMILGVLLNVLKPWPLKLIIDHVLEGAPWPTGLGWLTRLPGADRPQTMILWLAIGSIA